MKQLNFSIQINAPKEKVWSILLDDASYRRWTSVFHEGSYAVGDWKEGSKILFLGPDGSGMFSRIFRHVPNEFISIQHLGIVKNGVEDFDSEETKKWTGALENYSVSERDGATELLVELDTTGDFEAYFQKTWPKALGVVKELAEVQKITPFLWFDDRIEEALNLYSSVFPNSKIWNIVRNGDTVFTADFSLGGQKFAALNGGPQFQFNPSISFFVVCETETEVDNAWQKLSESGSVLMPLDKYPWSEKYGWLQDRYGLSWQLSLGKISDVGQKITPSLLFVGEQHGRAEEALHYYSSVFKNAHTDGILRYVAGEPEKEGTVKHAQFSLEGQKFMVMDSGLPHAFQFNEALSFVISCDTQEEIDHFWNKLTGGGGQESQCGWLKDKFGVSWQVIPPVLVKYLNDPNPVKANNVMQAMMKMSRIDIATLQKAYEQE